MKIWHLTTEITQVLYEYTSELPVFVFTVTNQPFAFIHICVCAHARTRVHGNPKPSKVQHTWNVPATANILCHFKLIHILTTLFICSFLITFLHCHLPSMDIFQYDTCPPHPKICSTCLFFPTMLPKLSELINLQVFLVTSFYYIKSNKRDLELQVTLNKSFCLKYL